MYKIKSDTHILMHTHLPQQ